MKSKITLLIIFLLFVVELQAQTPSINETKSVSFLNTKSFQKKHKELQNEEMDILLKQKIKILKEQKNAIETKKDIIILKKYEDSILVINNEIIDVQDRINNFDKSLEIGINKEYYTNILIQKNDSIYMYYAVLKKDPYKNDKKAIDSIYKLINAKKLELQLIMNERDENLASLGKFHWILPTWDEKNRKMFFSDMYNNKEDKTIYLNSLALNSNSDATSIQNEIVTDNMWALRITFGTVLSLSTSDDDASTPEEIEEQKKNETEEEALSRLINGGGNFYLEALLPLFTTNQNNGDQITSYTYANVRGAMDLKEISSNIDTATGNGSLGINSYLGISSDTKKFNFFLQGNINYTMGSDEFYKNLGLNYEKPFLNGKVITGITISNKFRLSAILSAFGSDEKVRSNKITVGLQVLP